MEENQRKSFDSEEDGIVVDETGFFSGDDDASEWGRPVRPGLASVYGDGDVTFEDMIEERPLEAVSEIDENAASAVERCLLDVAASTQRMAAATLRRKYVRGRKHLDYVTSERQLMQQKMFQVANYMQVNSFDDEHVYDAIRQGGLITRMGAPTATGKSTRFPALVAQKCGVRVCMVVLDANKARSDLRIMKERYTVVGSHRTWVREKKAYLAVVSYFDFHGIVESAGYKRFFSDFDVFIFDEPQVKDWYTYACKHAFAVYARPGTTLILLSATVSTEASNDVVAQRVGRMEEAPVPGGLDGLMTSGLLVGKYLRDQSIVIAPYPQKAYAVRQYYEDAGIDVRVLDWGSSVADEANMFSWLKTPTAVTPRVLVVVPEYGVASSFPLSYTVASCTKLIYVPTLEGALIEKEVPIEESEAKQNAGRTGRGLAVGSGGIYASMERAVIEGDLARYACLDAYLALVSMSINPRSDLFADVKKLFPQGLSRETASMLLSIELPRHLVIRYLGSDGRIAARFVNGMALFQQRDHFLEPSNDVDPVGYSSWIQEELGGYCEGDDTNSVIRVDVPFASPPTLKAAMHTLSAMAKGWMRLRAWHPDVNDSAESEDEDLGIRARVKAPKRKIPLRLIVDEVQPEVEVRPVAPEPWVFNEKPVAAKDNRRRRNSGRVWSSDAAKQFALDMLQQRAEGKRSFEAQAYEVSREEDDKGKTLVSVSRPAEIEMHSPGGSSVLFTMSERMFEAFQAMRPLKQGYAVTMMSFVRKLRGKFVYSALFDVFGNPWITVLKTCASNDIVAYVKSQGYGVDMTHLLDKLWERFRGEVIVVCSKSNVYRSKVRKLWSKNISVSKLAQKINSGRMPVAQSETFLLRIGEIHQLYERALSCFEGQALFNPHLVTELQKGLPLRGNESKMPIVGGKVLDQEVFVPKSEWNK